MAEIDNKKMWESILKAKDLPQFENETITEWLQGVIRFALREQNLRFDGKEIVPATEEEIPQEPMFKVCDWIVSPNGVCWHIDKIEDGRYYVSCETGECADWPISSESIYHQWTIQDAKNGDVLSYVTDEEDLWIMIYWSLYEPYEGHVHYHALLVNDNFDDKGTCCICIDDLKPATKEQRELLFQKMKEEGYEWDADTKQLKKIDFDDVDPNHLIHEHIDPQELVSSELDEFENRLGEIIFPTWDIMQGCESCQADIDHVKELAKDLLSIARKQIAGEIDVDDIVDKWNGLNKILPPEGWYRLGVMDVKNLIEKGE